MNRDSVGAEQRQGALHERVAAITGAGGGLGSAVAQLFAEEGAAVVAIDRDHDAASRLVGELAGKGHRPFGLDVADAAGGSRLFDRLDRVDVLVNAAGIREIDGPLDLSAAEWSRTIEVNLTGTFLCARNAAQIMRRKGGGSIVNISSVAGLAGFPMRPAYSASKAGVLGLTRSLSQDLAQYGIRVNAICPGLIRTPLTARYLRDEDFVERLGETIPMARPGEPEDVAEAALYLAAPRSGFVTGSALTVDGGFVAAGSFDVGGEGSAFTKRGQEL